MPVYGYSGQVLASMCTLGPRIRVTQQKLRELRCPLAKLSRSLSERLGWHG